MNTMDTTFTFTTLQSYKAFHKTLKRLNLYFSSMSIYIIQKKKALIIVQGRLNTIFKENP